MKKLCSILSVVLLSVAFCMLTSTVLAEETDCNLENVKVDFSAQIDAEFACEGVRRALNFFEAYGFSGFRHIHVIIVDRIISESMAKIDSNKEKQIFCAFYDRIAEHCIITSLETVLAEQKMVFSSIAITPEYYCSIVAHEVAHNLYHQIFESIGKEVERPLTEYVSYVVQIETLQEKEKLQVLELWPGKILRSNYQVSSLVWAMNPNLFGIMSYRYHCKHPNFIKSILDGEAISGDIIVPSK